MEDKKQTPTRVINLYKEPYDVYIGRGSKWGNPYTTIQDKDTMASEIVETSEEAISKYREHVLNTPELMESLDELEGKTLGCFCKPKPCHGDVLLELLTQKKFKKLPQRHRATACINHVKLAPARRFSNLLPRSA